MKRLQKTKNKILALVSVSLVVFLILILSSIYFENRSKLLNDEKLYFQNATSAHSNLLKEYDKFYKTRLKSIINVDSVLQAIETKDRKLLEKLLTKHWSILKSENEDLTIFHFHLPDGTTLLRMHNPQFFGDNIAKKRAMLAYIHQYKKPISNYEAGVSLLGYRVLLPIFYKNKYIGAVEFGSKANIILNKMKKTNGISGLVFSKEAKIFDNKNTNAFKISEYILQKSTLDDKKLINYIPKDYKLDKYISITKDDKTYALYYINHLDFLGNVSAKTLLFNDITDIKEQFINSIYRLILVSLFLFIVFILTIKYGFEQLLNKVDKTNLKLKQNIAFLNSYQLALDESSIVSKSNLEGKITYVNDKLCEVSGYSKDELLGQPHSILRHPSTPHEIFHDLWKTIRSRKVWNGVLQNKGKTNDYWVDIAVLPILDENNTISEYIAIRHDITEMKKQEERLDKFLNIDDLTGYGNRYKFNTDLKNCNKPAIAIVNIDNFSQINDFYGHATGDVIIKRLAILIDKLIQNNNSELYHLQGDEYVILNEHSSKDAFYKQIDELREIISNTSIDINDETLLLNTTISLSFESKENLLVTADMALKVAKKQNKDILIYNNDISLNREYENNIKWTKKIKKAIEDDKIVPVFQPIVNNVTGKWEKYEALVRLIDEESNIISPYFFLEISKKTKYYTQITKIMIKKSFEMFKDKDLEFSVNLTIDDIKNENIKEYIFDMLQKYNIGHKVVFEIVESESIEDFEEVAKFISTVKDYGCKIAIDDFGTGYSNFEYLLKLKADFIKIDGSMIKDIDTNKDAQLVVSTIVNFAKKLGIKTIAEFVENESILAKIKELGIDYSQGYYFSKPELSL